MLKSKSVCYAQIWPKGSVAGGKGQERSQTANIAEWWTGKGGRAAPGLVSHADVIRELKQHRRRRLQKRQLKSVFAPLQTLSRLFHLVYFVKCWQMFLELNSKGLYQSSGKEKKVVVLCSRPRQNVNSGTFTFWSGNDGKEMYKKARCTCKVFVLLIKPIAFFAVLVAFRAVVG